MVGHEILAPSTMSLVSMKTFWLPTELWLTKPIINQLVIHYRLGGYNASDL